MTMFKDVIKLVSKTITQDEYFREIEVETERTIFADKQSVNQSEFFAAGQSGLKAEYKFIVRLSEYKGENELLFNGKHYTIYRTYEIGENIELYCHARVGV